MSETWKSPRKIEEEYQQELEAERQRQYELFDSLAEMLDAEIITMDELTVAMMAARRDSILGGQSDENPSGEDKQ